MALQAEPIRQTIPPSLSADSLASFFDSRIVLVDSASSTHANQGEVGAAVQIVAVALHGCTAWQHATAWPTKQHRHIFALHGVLLV